MRSSTAPQERRKRAPVDAARTPMLAAAFARRPHGVHGGATASLPRRRGVSSALALRVHRPLSRRLDRCDRVIQNEGDDSIGGKV